MRICILNVIHEPFDKRVYHKIGLSLVAGGHQVVSICPRPAQGEVPDDSSKYPIEFVLTEPAATFPQRFLSALRLASLGRRKKADVYMAPEPESWFAALLIKLFHGGRVVFDMHEHYPSELAKFFPKPVHWVMEWMTLRFMRLFARFTDLIILTRTSFEECWTGINVPRITVINTNHLQPRCSVFDEDVAELFKGVPSILHQGIFGDTRGSYQLLDTVKILVQKYPALKCVILGEYVYGSLEEYRSKIRAANLEKTMVLIPPVSYEKVPQYIAACNVGLILFQPGSINHTLAMPHKLFDYMREAKPVVAPAFAVEVAKIVRETNCGLLVDVTDAAAIAKAVSELLDNPERALQLGESGRKGVETEYNWQKEEETLLNAFRALEER